ncbi:hypothetical protein [Prosthecobacter fluviatilis]|uniref:Uncharacterized protein n=1 Tax=Prosthecobacter fluviatilis TaxID=445931 RepID=A0ABW0KPF9_9BACT
MISESDLLAALHYGYEGYISNGYLRRDELPGYASQLKEDLDWIGLESFKLLPPKKIRVRIGSGFYKIPIVRYHFGEDRNSFEKALPFSSKFELLTKANTEGTGFNSEDLRWVCDVFRTARNKLPHLWLKDKRLKNDLQHPRKHINAIAELFWLGLWNDVVPETIAHEHSLLPKPDDLATYSKTVDWSMLTIPIDQSGRQHRVNLEVKNLTSSVEYALFNQHRSEAANQMDLDRFVTDALRGTAKFPNVISDDINLVCFSTFLNVPCALQSLASAVLNKYPSVDAVLFWIVFGDTHQNWQVFSRQLDEWQNRKSSIIDRLFERPSYRQAKPLLFTHPLWGLLPWQQY